MSLRKFATFQVISKVLVPQDASKATLRRMAHRHEFQYEPRPGYLYVRSRAISSRCNDNFDEFPAEEIKKAYATFVGKPVFVNHHNDNHRRARGVIIDAALHEDSNPDGTPDTWAEVLMEVDAVRFPKLAQAILAGHIDRTSMGTDVAFSICSACNNKASSPAEYCEHIPRMKGKRIYRATASGRKEGVLIRERCYGLGFFENSLLVEEPADPTAYFLGVDDRGMKATASKDASLAAVVKEAADSLAQDVPPRFKGGDIVHNWRENRSGIVTRVFPAPPSDHPDAARGRDGRAINTPHGYHVAWGPGGWEDDQPDWKPDTSVPHMRPNVAQAYLEHRTGFGVEPYMTEDQRGRIQAEDDHRRRSQEQTDQTYADQDAAAARRRMHVVTQRKTANHPDFFDPGHYGPKGMTERPHPDQMSAGDLHAHLSEDHGYHPDDIEQQHDVFHGDGTPRSGDSLRASLENMHNWSHSASNYGLDPAHSGRPMEANDVPHVHPGWTPGKTNSFGTDWGTGDSTHTDTGSAVHHIDLSDDDRDFYRHMRDAGEQRAQMHEHNQKRVVDLSDPTDLKSHLLESHGWTDDDFWRNSHPEDHPGMMASTDLDRPLTHTETRAAHDHEHNALYPQDYQGAMTLGDSHFHTASRTAYRVESGNRVQRSAPTDAHCLICGDQGLKFNADAWGNSSQHFPGQVLNGWSHNDGMRRDHQAVPHDDRDGHAEVDAYQRKIEDAMPRVREHMNSLFDQMHVRNEVNDAFSHPDLPGFHGSLSTEAVKPKKPVDEMSPEEYEEHQANVAKGRAEGQKWVRQNPPRIKHVVNHWLQATDDEKANGKNWYADAHHLAKHIAADTGHDMSTVAGLVSNYSPQTHWSANIMNAARVARTRQPLGGKGDGILATKNQKKAAGRILDGEHYDKVLAGPKTRAFAHLIEHGDNQSDHDPKVVVDRHAMSVACGNRASDNAYSESRLGTKGVYNHYSDIYHKAAKHISKLEGTEVKAHQVQATTWLVRQRLNEQEDRDLSSTAGSRSATAARRAVEKWNSYAAEHHPAAMGKEPGTGYSQGAPDDVKHAQDMADERHEHGLAAESARRTAVGPMGHGGERGDGRHKHRRTSHCRVCGSDIYMVGNGWQHDIDTGAGVPHMAEPDGEVDGDGDDAGSATASRRLAYGETKAPTDVDTLRDEECPVCGERDSYDGNACQVCGFDAPPQMFQDPDLDKAKSLDLRKDVVQDAGTLPGQDGLTDAQQDANGGLPGEVPGEVVPGSDAVPVDPSMVTEDGEVTPTTDPAQILQQQMEQLQSGVPLTPDQLGPNGEIAPAQPGIDADVDVDAATGHVNQGGEPFTPGPNAPTGPGEPEGPGGPMDEEQEEEPDGQQVNPDAGQGVPGTPDDGVPDLQCPACGFEADAAQPTSVNMDDPTAPNATGDGMLAGDVCPNCQQAQLVSVGEAEQMQQPVPVG